MITRRALSVLRSSLRHAVCTVLLLLPAPVANATSYSMSGLITATITTDGNTGVIGDSDLTSWNWQAHNAPAGDGAAYGMYPYGYIQAPGTGSFAQGAMLATASPLSLSYTDPATSSILLYENAKSVGTGYVESALFITTEGGTTGPWDVRFTVTPFAYAVQLANPQSGRYGGQPYSFTMDYSTTMPTGPFVLNQTITPEPPTVVLALLGLAGCLQSSPLSKECGGFVRAPGTFSAEDCGVRWTTQGR